MKGRRVVVVASLALATVAAVACEQALSIDRPVVVAPRDACGLPVSVSSCQACLATNCCAQASACAGEPACAAHESCMLECGTDYGCRARCEVESPVAFPSGVPAMDTCIARSCDVPCGVSCGLNTSYADPDAAPLCQSCIGGNICPQVKACTTDIACQNVFHCALACRTPDCQGACIERYDGGAFRGYEEALVSSCLTQCQFGAIWSCVGKVTWPLAKSATQTVTLTLTDALSGTALEGVVARSCDRSDQECTSSFGTGTTDAHGQVTLTLPRASIYGFNGYFDLAPPGLGSLRYLLFTSSPLSEPNAQLGTGMFSASALESLASAVGVTLDLQRGHILGAADDCMLGPATGVTVSAQGIDAQTKLFYYGASSLDPAATLTGWSGLAFFFNVPSLVVTLNVTPEKLGRATSTETVFTRPKALSLVRLTPTP